jgi:hypothetical protein
MWVPIVAEDRDRREDRSRATTMGRSVRYDQVFDNR